MTYHLAIDVGASSGRFILGNLNKKIELEEIYRFENGIEFNGEYHVWNLTKLFDNIICGLKVCKKIGKIPSTIAIDTWGVDYVLMKGDKEILPCVSYRDVRTLTTPQEVFEIIPNEKLYSNTGIQSNNYNTLFQLYCDLKSGKMEHADSFLMMPEYLSYKLTGIKKHEYTICTTTGLINAESKTWDLDIINNLGFKKTLFSQVFPSCTSVGKLSNSVKNLVGFDSEVIFCPAHDTASAVCACPLNDTSIFISSGTWSLVGTENSSPILSKEALTSGLSNEGGIDYRFRLLKNIMGMWIFQSIKKELGGKYSYDEMMHLAMESNYIKTFDPSSSCFLNPNSMIDAIRNELQDNSLSLNDVINSAYHSLANTYKNTLLEIEKLTNKKITKIVIVGGGSKDTYLNNLTEEYANVPVYIGPTEGSALGNIISQIKFFNPLLSLEEIRNNMI